MLVVSADKQDEVFAFAKKLEKEAEESDYEFSLPNWAMESEGLWLYSDESVNEEGLIKLVQGVLTILDTDEPFIVSVAYTCSKPRISEFGGYAYKIWQNDWDSVEARSAAEKLESQKVD
jgi:hypothetical protein